MANDNTMEDDLVLSDDLVPNDGEPFQPDIEPERDEELEEQLTQERAVLSSAMPIWEDLQKWLDDGIEAADSVTQAHITAERYKVDIAQALIAHDIVRRLIQQKKIDLVQLYEVYVKQKQ